jgi:hypothetical protein
MNEIVKALRWLAKGTEFLFAAEQLGDAADLIESLQAQLSASQRRERAAVEDIEKMMRICEKGSCHFCADGDCTDSPYCSPKWRGPKWRGLQDVRGDSNER